MTEPKATCRACGTKIPVQWAEATGGYCRTRKCEAEREVLKRREHQRAIIEKLTEEGTIQPCLLCGKLIRTSRLKKHTEQKCERLPHPHPYKDVLPHVSIPEWLEQLASASCLPPLIPIQDVLRESCFYPSSGLDSSPVLLSNGCVHSFIYVDYGTSHKDFIQKILSPGFSPYILILGRDVERQELVPDGWTPQLPQWFDNLGFDGQQCLKNAMSRCHPFGHWSIWQRREKRDERVGPRLFSFLFLGGEALASYQGLYTRNKITPKILAIIQPGHLCGDNWTNFNNPSAPLWKEISQGAGLPEFLLLGSYSLGSYSGGSISMECPFAGYTFIKKTRTYEDRMEREIDIFKKNI